MAGHIGLLFFLGSASNALNAQSPVELLAQADRLADQGNWAKARPIYAAAESEFRRLGDRRNMLLAELRPPSR